jgi:hypothetical protein
MKTGPGKFIRTPEMRALFQKMMLKRILDCLREVTE